MTHDERQLIIEKAEDELKSDWFNLPFNKMKREHLLKKAKKLFKKRLNAKRSWRKLRRR